MKTNSTFGWRMIPVALRAAFCVVSASMFVMTLAATAPAKAAETDKTVRIGVPDTSVGTKRSNVGTIDVLIDQELYENELKALGYTVEWTHFKGAGPAVVEALANEQIDLAYLGDLPAIISKAQGLDTVLIASSARNAAYYLGVAPNSDIKTVENLKGRSMAIFRGTVLQLSISKVLAAHGLTERDVKGVNLDVNSSNAALAGGQIDAVWGTNSLLALQEKGLAKVVLSTRDLKNVGSSQNVLIGRGKFLAEHLDLLPHILKVQRQAYEWLVVPANKDAYLQQLLSIGYSPSAVEAFRTDDFKVNYDPELDADYLAKLQESIDLAAELRVIRRGFKTSEWLVSQ